MPMVDMQLCYLILKFAGSNSTGSPELFFFLHLKKWWYDSIRRCYRSILASV